MVNKTVFGKRLKELMNIFNETTYSLGKQFALSPPSISRYTRGEMLPKITTINAMASYFDVNPKWLLGENVSMYAINLEDSYLTSSGYSDLSIFKSVAYNSPIFSNKKSEKSITVTIDDLTRWGPVFAMEIHDESMRPTLRKNDIIIIKMNTLLNDGKLIALHVNKSDLIIRKVVFAGTNIILQPHNPDFNCEVYDTNKDDIQMIGSVVYIKHTEITYINS